MIDRSGNPDPLLPYPGREARPPAAAVELPHPGRVLPSPPERCTAPDALPTQPVPLPNPYDREGGRAGAAAGWVGTGRQPFLPRIRVPDGPPALVGAYETPSLSPGDLAFCEYRRETCRVTSWTAAPIPWPRCNRVGVRGGSGLLVTGELVRAVRTETATALGYWFGICASAAWRLRTRFPSRPGTVGHEPPPDTPCRPKPPRAGRRGRPGPWTAEEHALLGSVPDDEVAARTGRTVVAIRSRRSDFRIPTCRDRRRRLPPATCLWRRPVYPPPSR